jgi:hypothetical protein
MKVEAMDAADWAMLGYSTYQDGWYQSEQE